MAASSFNLSKPSKWFSQNGFKLSLHHRRRPKPASPAPPASPNASRKGGGAKEVLEAFRRLDVDGDGRISGDELRSFFLAWAGEEVSPAGATAVMSEFDSDQDGFLNYEDFVRLVGSSRPTGYGGEDDDLRRAFEMFETEKGAGCITADGLSRMLSRLGDVKSQEECAGMIRAYDLNGDGVLDYDEFHCMMA